MALSLPVQRQLFAVLRKAGIDDDQRRDLIRQYTDGRTDSTTGMYDVEAGRLIANVRQQYNPLTDFWKGDPMRKKVIAICRSMGWEQEGKADMDRINAWCVDRGPYKKPLNNHTTNELPKLIHQVEQVYEWWLNQVNKENE